MKNNTFSKAVALFFVLVFYVSIGWAQTTIFEEAVPTFTELPDGWTGVNSGGLDGIVQTSTGGYLLVDDAGDYVETMEYDLSLYNNITLNVDVATYGSGDAHPLFIEVSNDGGISWNHETFTSATPSSSTYITGGPFSITADASNVKFRFSRVSADGRGVRFRNILLEGELPDYATLFEFSNANANLGDAAWFSDFRSFAADANNLYFGKPNVIEVVDRFTGVKTGNLNTTGITGGWRNINDVEVSADGDIFAANGILGVGDNFKVYHVSTDPLVEPVNVLDFDFSTIFTSTRIGDKFTVVGSKDNGSLAIYAAESNGPSPARIVKWLINSAPGDPISFGDPVVIDVAQKGSANQVAPLPNGNFYHTGAGISINKYDAEGNLLGSIPGGIVPTGSTAIKYIGMDGDDEMLAVYHYGASDGYLRLVRIVGGVAANATLEFSTPQLGPNNSAGSGDVAFVPNADGMNVDLYVMDGSDGFGGYSTNNLDIEFPVYLPMPETVVDIIVGSEVHTTLEAAVLAADLAGTLSGDGPFTVFAPTDAAFAALPDGLLDDLLAEPSGLLTQILLYHVVGATAMSGDLTDGQMVTTLQGQDVTVTINDDGIFINDAEVILADIVADNGVVHVIDAVLVPEEIPATVVDIIVDSEVHTTLEAAVLAADLAGTLSGDGPFTVFAPTDAAFAALPDGLLDDLLAEPSGLLTQILLYHVVGATAMSGDLTDGQMVTTLQGQDVTVTINDDGIFINDAEVIMADLVAGNGVVHVIDAVLVPDEGPLVIDEFPWTETFEDDSWSRPEWTQIQEVGTSNWTFAAGSSGGSITTAYEGALNARFVSSSGSNSPITKLVTPFLDLTSLTTPRIAFWYGQQLWSPDQNELKIYYRTAADQPWVEIAHLTDDVAEWTKAAFPLPEASATYQVALEGINNWGRANVVDLFTVEESPTLFSVTFNVADELAAPVANATITLNGNANAEGDYLFEDVEPGTYSYSIVAPLFDPFEGEVTVVDADVVEEVTLIAGVPVLAASVATLNLGFAVNGLTSTSAVLTVTNEGFAPAEIADGDISLTGTNAADFTFTLVDDLLTYPISLENGESFDVEVTYTPTSAVEAEAQLVVVSNADDDLVVELIAVGYDPLTQFFDNLDEYTDGIGTSPWSGFAQTAATGSFVDISTAGTAYSEPLQARIANGNNSSGEVMLITPLVTDLDVSWVRFYARMGVSSQTEPLEVGYLTDPGDPTTIQPIDTVSVTGSYQQFAVSFADIVDPLPENAYVYFRHLFGATFRIYLVDDIAYEPVPATPILSVDKDVVDFGNTTYLGETVTQNVVVSNTGVGIITLNEADFTLTGADAANFDLIFTDDVTLPVELETAESYTLTITFSPEAEVVYTAALEIEDNLGKGITTVSLTGTGYDPTITPEFVYDFIGDFPPMDWANLEGILSNDTELTPASLWVHDKFGNVDALPENNSARVNIYSSRHAWLVTPPIDLGDGTTPYMLSFDLALTQWNNSNPGTLENKRVAVVISTDNGATWSDANILREWVDGDVISNTGQTEIIDLGAYSGIVKIGFYGASTSTPTDLDLFVTNVGVEEAVYQTVTFNVTDAADVAITDAAVTYNGETINAAPYEFISVAGTYAYEVSKAGYQTVNGSVTVGDVDVIVDVVLEELFVVDFTVTDFDMTALEGVEIAISGDATMMATTDASGMASVQLENGTYEAIVSMMGYVSDTLDILVDGVSLTFDVELADMVAEPFNLMVEVDGSDALFSWNNPVATEFSEGFEGDVFPPAGWITLNPDGGTGWISLDSGTSPLPGWTGGTADAAPDGGLKMAYASWQQGGAASNDQWIVTPALIADDNFQLTFNLRRWPVSYDDNVDIRISTTVQDDPAAFDIIVDELVFTDTDSDLWESYSYDISGLVAEGATFYIGIREHVADNFNDGASVMLDNVYYGPEGDKFLISDQISSETGLVGERDYNYVFVPKPKSEKAFLGYTVYLNDAEIESGLQTTEYQFTDLPFGTHEAGVKSVYSSGESDIVTTEFTIELPVVDPLPMAMLYDATGDNLPAEIGTGGNARSAAIYLDRYVIVPSREGGPQVWAFDMINPHLEPMALDMGTDLIVGGLFPVSYVEIVGDDIYVSNMSLGSDANHPFRVYRWSSLDAAPELVLSSDGGWGRLGDAFTIIGDPAADGSIVAHINSDPGENPLRRKFRKFDFAGGVIQNEDAPELVEVTLPEGVGTMNSYGVMKLIENETDKFLVTSNAIGMAVVDGAGNNLAYVGTDVFPSRTMDANIFYHNGNRYLSYVVNKEWETLTGDFTAAYYQVVDITLGATVEEAITLISTPADLINRTVHSASIGDGSAFLGGTNKVVKSGDDILILSHVVARGFKLVTSGAAMDAYALTVEAAPVEGGTVTGGGDFFEGATVPVTATPADGYQFVNWTVGDTEVGTNAEFDYTMPGEATTLVANFETLPVVDVATLAELRALPADGSLYRYTGDAVIVAMDGFRNRKFLQDATAAIMIDDNAGTITTEYDLYDEITDVLGFTTVFRNLLQFVPQENTAESTANTPVDPTVFTLDEVTQDDQAKYIKFMDVTFVGIEPDSLFANGTNYTVTDGTNNFVVRTDFWNTDLFNTEIPTGPVNISGVVITFNETLQLVPRFAADIEEYLPGFNVTFNIDMTPAAGFDPAADMVYITGSMFSWATPGDDPDNQTMTRVDDSMIWTKTLKLEEGTYEYKYFINAGWDGGEWAGEPNRSVTVNGDMVVNNVWADLVNVNDLELANINLYPNPARDYFHVTAATTIRSIVISDITGKVVYNDIINDSQVRVQNQFDTGIYILHIHTDEGVVVRKLQIQK